MQHPLGATLESQQHIAVVVELAALHEGGDVSSQFLDLQTCHVLSQILGVRADVANAAGGAAALGVSTPVGLFLAGGLKVCGQPALRILGDNLANLAQFACGDHVARLLHQLIAGVVVRQSIKKPRLLDDLAKALRLLEIKRRRLIAEHVKTIFQCHLGRRVMHMVRRHDGHEIHPLIRGQGRLFLDHFLKRAVAAFGGEKQVAATGLGFPWTAGERATDQFNLLIHCRGDAMHRTDESAASAADHSVTNFSAHNKKYRGGLLWCSPRV